ncbi:nutrient deprivation-induced protein (plasmid) [Ensifer adhaerens]|uniref:nutrient deprivation-induced protein n=1 Tax=Ensifer adhaerens TaxID=106592 RepID=UPI001CC12C68|nr:nutrient deprivation-induced protein [Ensifer adhaerens]MBZ7927538.1 nutrient deprivation-induced protein [Ensifer adhaerens]UAX97954.1 nutrient deprivation-induced protein [Ensifer adhaerens]UAY05333.1 nutrient deprivation-induced protein [Ensifer adhaerens]UAY12711.1 nutrient deprivation-induced protein [Ensifer adhaerens]
MIDDPRDRRPQLQERLSPSQESNRQQEDVDNNSIDWRAETRTENRAGGNSPANGPATQAKAAASQVVDHEKSALARQLRGLAGAMEKVGAELRQSDQPGLGRYTQQIGNSIGRLAHDCEDKELGEIASMAEDFGRKQPLAFLGMAAIAGLAASRFLSASAERTHNNPEKPRPNPGPPGGKDGDWDFEKELGDA